MKNHCGCYTDHCTSCWGCTDRIGPGIPGPLCTEHRMTFVEELPRNLSATFERLRKHKLEQNMDRCIVGSGGASPQGSGVEYGRMLTVDFLDFSAIKTLRSIGDMR